jgi:hypothetical protein
MMGEAYNEHYRNLPSEYSMEQLVAKYQAGEVLYWRDRIDVERYLRVREQNNEIAR